MVPVVNLLEEVLNGDEFQRRGHFGFSFGLFFLGVGLALPYSFPENLVKRNGSRQNQQKGKGKNDEGDVETHVGKFPGPSGDGLGFHTGDPVRRSLPAKIRFCPRCDLRVFYVAGVQRHHTLEHGPVGNAVLEALFHQYGLPSGGIDADGGYSRRLEVTFLNQIKKAPVESTGAFLF